MSDNNATIVADAAHHDEDRSSMAAAQALLLARWSKDAEKPSRADEEERAEHEEDDAHELPDNSESSTEDYEAPEDALEADHDEQSRTRRKAEDDDEVEVTVDGNTKRLSVKELRRLAGQEQALQQKSQAAAELRKQAEAKQTYLESRYQALIAHATAEWNEFKDLDPNEFIHTHGVENYRIIKQERDRRENNLRMLHENMQDFQRRTQAERNKAVQAQAVETRRELEKRIPGFNKEYLDKLVNYALSQGIPQDKVVNTLDPNEIVAWDKARQYDEMLAKGSELKRKAAEPARVLKPSAPAPVKRTSADKDMAELRKTGSKAAAERILAARFRR